MESAEAGAVDKAYCLEEQFQDDFCWIGHSVHELRAGEMAGKGANLNSAVHELFQMEWAGSKVPTISAALTQHPSPSPNNTCP